MSSNFPRVPGVILRVSSGRERHRYDAEAVVESEVAATATLELDDRGREWRAIVKLEVAAGVEDPMVPATLLRWAEVEAQTIIQRERAPKVRSGLVPPNVTVLLCVDDPPEDEATLEALAAAKLSLAVAEDEMSRPVERGAGRVFSDTFLVVPWTDQAAPLFHHAYFDAFRDRPGFPGWDEPRWRAAFASDAAFRSDLSVVLLDGPEPAAHAVLWVEPGDTAGWIVQMGVRPGWRGQGLGEGLLRHALSAFAAEGLRTASLEVATNNAAARALYERMGFAVSGSHRSWRKTL